MPVDQLIDKMRAKFSSFKTLIIDQSTHVLDPQDQETTMVFRRKHGLSLQDITAQRSQDGRREKGRLHMRLRRGKGAVTLPLDCF